MPSNLPDNKFYILIGIIILFIAFCSIFPSVIEELMNICSPEEEDEE